MTKREIIAAVLLALLIALSVYNILSIDALTGDIGIALSKSQSAAEKLDFKAARGLSHRGAGALAVRRELHPYLSPPPGD